MKVILCKSVEGLGNKGDVVKVSDGYARNSLIPKGTVIKATPGSEAQAKEMKRSWVVKDAQDKASAETLAQQVASHTIIIGAKVGKEGKLFGSVGTSDIALALSDAMAFEIDKKMIALDSPIREIGEYSVNVKLHSEVDVPVSLVVEPS